MIWLLFSMEPCNYHTAHQHKRLSRMNTQFKAVILCVWYSVFLLLRYSVFLCFCCSVFICFCYMPVVRVLLLLSFWRSGLKALQEIYNNGSKIQQVEVRASEYNGLLAYRINKHMLSLSFPSEIRSFCHSLEAIACHKIHPCIFWASDIKCLNLIHLSSFECVKLIWCIFSPERYTSKRQVHARHFSLFFNILWHLSQFIYYVFIHLFNLLVDLDLILFFVMRIKSKEVKYSKEK